MSYYSDVAIVIRTDDYAEINKTIVSTFATDFSKHKMWNKAKVYRLKDSVVLKWYQEEWEHWESDVQWIYEQLKGKSYYFIRLGEQLEDVECWGRGDYEELANEISVERRITI